MPHSAWCLVESQRRQPLSTGGIVNVGKRSLRTVSALQRTQQLAPRVRAARRRRRLGKANLTFHTPVGAYEWGWPTPMSIASVSKGKLNRESLLRDSDRRPLVRPRPRTFQRLADGQHGIVAEAAAD